MMRSPDQVFVSQTKHDGALDDLTSVLSRVRPLLGSLLQVEVRNWKRAFCNETIYAQGSPITWGTQYMYIIVV